jgi:hypothetical protein
VSKLKEDMLRVKGDIAVLVTIALPDDVKNFTYKDGIYVTTFDCFTSLATVIRKIVIDHQIIKSSVVGKNEKMEMVYNYFLSNEFRQRVESILETFTNMKSQLDSEKRIFAKVWAEREKQIDKILNNTAAMQGDLAGLMGPELQSVDSLEAMALLTDGFSDEPASDDVVTREMTSDNLITETFTPEQSTLFDDAKVIES